MLQILCISAALMSCTHNHTEKEGVSSEENHDNLIVVSEHQAKHIGIKTETVRKGNFHRVLKVSGSILSTIGTEKYLAATTSGIISFREGLNEGVEVTNGEPLFTISAKGIENGDQVEKMKLELANAERELQRAQELIKKSIISQKDFDQIKLRHDIAKNALSGMNDLNYSHGNSVCSNMNGFVKQILVQAGTYVTPGQPLALITQNRKLQLRAEVSEKDYMFLNEINSAHFRTESSKTPISLDSIGGKLVSVGKSLTPGNFYLPVIFECNNVGNLIPGSFAEIWLTGAEKTDALTIPLSALTEEQGVYFVYIQKDCEHYEKREVKTGSQDGLRVEILEGLKENEKVVSKGAIHVRLASQSGAIPEGHNHSH